MEGGGCVRSTKMNISREKTNAVSDTEDDMPVLCDEENTWEKTPLKNDMPGSCKIDMNIEYIIKKNIVKEPICIDSDI